jgi:deazaflavin-dependent oxidoreductase (nitroreductase family)
MMSEHPLGVEQGRWIAQQVELYRQTDGAEAGSADNPDGEPAPVLLLETTGARTGQERVTPLVFQRDGDDYVVVASVMGLDRSPGWYHNLVARPEATIQVGADRIAVTATVASAGERERLWALMTAALPAYDVYQRGTERVIPVVRLTPRG